MAIFQLAYVATLMTLSLPNLKGSLAKLQWATVKTLKIDSKTESLYHAIRNFMKTAFDFLLSPCGESMSEMAGYFLGRAVDRKFI